MIISNIRIGLLCSQGSSPFHPDDEKKFDQVGRLFSAESSVVIDVVDAIGGESDAGAFKSGTGTFDDSSTSGFLLLSRGTTVHQLSFRMA